MKRGLVMDATGWLVLAIIVALVLIGLFLLFRDPVTELLQETLDRLRF